MDLPSTLMGRKQNKKHRLTCFNEENVRLVVLKKNPRSFLPPITDYKFFPTVNYFTILYEEELFLPDLGSDLASLADY